MRRARFFTAIFALTLASCATPQAEPQFPVTPRLFLDRFEAAEGITFNGAGELHVGANRAVWRIDPDGTATKLADADSNLGQAGIGPVDVLAADFGPKTLLQHGDDAPRDGVVWRVSPDGKRQAAARGIGDPNAIQIMPQGGFLVSDDFTDHIYLVDAEGAVSIWSDAVPFPNGIALSPDGKTLYAAQIFDAIRPKVILSGALWAIVVNPDGSAGEAKRLFKLGDARGFDGIVLDRLGRIYIADNTNGRVLRYDPSDETIVTIAEGIQHVASLVFGEGAFNHTSIYATTTFRGGGDIWEIPVGIEGLPPIR